MEIEREKKFVLAEGNSRDLVARFYEKTFVDGYTRSIGFGDRVSGLKVEDNYLDTGDFGLSRQNASLRARRTIKNGCARYNGNGIIEITLKLKAGMDERVEISDQISGEVYNGLDLNNTDLQSLRIAREISGYRILLRVFRLITERRTLNFRDGENCFEVAFDDLNYIKENGNTARRIKIIEVEQKSGERRSFYPFCESIRRVHGCTELKKSKYTIGLDFVQRKA